MNSNIIIPGRPDGNLTQVSHIPLTCPGSPGNIKMIKGCEFVPPVTLNRDCLYFIVVTFRDPYIPQPGWYDVPEKGHVTWIKSFSLIQVSNPCLPQKLRCWVFEAFEGLPPIEAVVPRRPPRGFFN